MQYNKEIKNIIPSLYEAGSTWTYPSRQIWILENGTMPNLTSFSGYFNIDNIMKELSKKFICEDAFSIDDFLFKTKKQYKKIKNDNVIKVNGRLIIEINDVRYINKKGESINEFINNSYDYEYEDFEEKIETDDFNFNDFKRIGRIKIYHDSECDSSVVEEIFKICKKNLFEDDCKSESRINLIVNSRMGGYSLNRFILNKPNIDIELNYGSELLSAHETIVKKLNQKNGKGVVLLHGEPGSGKTNYIKLLLSLLKKYVIYVPPMMTEFISSEKFIPFLMDYPNSILVIEDGENVIKKREGQDSQAVANLLNLSDGILGECLKMQVIVTFNADISTIDPALMRKGRLIAEHKFGKLQKEFAQKLSDKLGFKTKITEDMLLTDIYNQNEKVHKNSESKNKIGF